MISQRYHGFVISQDMSGQMRLQFMGKSARISTKSFAAAEKLVDRIYDNVARTMVRGAEHQEFLRTGYKP